MACFWTDLVGLDQDCGSDVVEVVDVRVENGLVDLDEGDMDPIPEWFDPATDFTLSIDGGGSFLYAYDVETDRFEGDSLSSLSGTTVNGTLTQGSNSTPAEISVTLS